MTDTVEPPRAVPIRHVILDRDGVLNREAPAHGYVRRPDEWHWIPGSLPALAALSRAGVRVSVATNQSGVGRGLMSEQDLAAIHAQMLRDVGEAGGRIDAIHACTHAPDANCDCRKPAPGLVTQAVEASGIPAAETLLVGDAERDVEAAQRAGVAAVLVRTGKGVAAVEALSHSRLPVYDDLQAFVLALLAERAGEGRDRT